MSVAAVPATTDRALDLFDSIRRELAADDPARTVLGLRPCRVAGHRVAGFDPEVLAGFRERLGDDITADDLSDYVYGLLHSFEHRARFAADLGAVPLRIRRVTTREAFDALREAGWELGDLHVRYDRVERFPLDEDVAPTAPDDPWERWRAGRMRFATARDSRGRIVADRSTIVYNDHVALRGIPKEAHRYVLGPRSAIEWAMDRYRVGVGNASDRSRGSSDPRHVVDLLERIVTVSVETSRIVESLPPIVLD